MKHLHTSVAFVAFVVVGIVAPELAHAQTPGPHANLVSEADQLSEHPQGSTRASPPPDPKAWIGGSLGLSPLGTLEQSLAGMTASVDTATAFGIGGRVEYRVTPIISIGFAPELVLNVKGTNGTDSASELDLPVRVAAGTVVAPKVRLYGYLAPGYSILFPPSDTQGNTTHPSGFMLGFGGGAGYQVAPNFMVTGELGYQFRFLSTSVGGVDTSVHVNYLTFAVGALVAIGG